MRVKKEQLEFLRKFRYIVENEEYKKLKNVPRHGSTNTYAHSVRVALMAYKLAKKWHMDADSAGKIGLLHDFCMIDYHKDDGTSHGGRWYCFYHGEDAIENSEKQKFYLNHVEKRAILTHMFPLSTRLPNSRLAYLLTLSDKTVALQESLQNIVIAFARLRYRTAMLQKRAAQYLRTKLSFS